jgi:hypothetical protein
MEGSFQTLRAGCVSKLGAAKALLLDRLILFKTTLLFSTEFQSENTGLIDPCVALKQTQSTMA